jgi:hypothetical protein
MKPSEIGFLRVCFTISLHLVPNGNSNAALGVRFQNGTLMTASEMTICGDSQWRHAQWRHAQWRHSQWRHSQWRHSQWSDATTSLDSFLNPVYW